MSPSSKGVPHPRKTLPRRPPPPLDWAYLTEECLILLFAYLPKADLRSVGLVCRNWSTAQAIALKNTLVLTVFTGQEDLLPGDPETALPFHNLAALKRKVALSRIALPNLEPATINRLLGVFPYVKDLSLSASEIQDASGLVDILRGLSSTLVKLHLVFTFSESTDDLSDLASSLEILSAVNALPHLKTLTLDMPVSIIEKDEDGNVISSEKYFSFPALSRLAEFNLKTRNNAKYLVESFRNFATGNASLQTIRLESLTRDPSSWESYLQLNGRLLSQFKYLQVNFEVNLLESLPFSRLFPLLISLTDLKYSIEGEAEEETPYSEVISQLATLASLKVLKLAIATYLPLGGPEVPVGLLQLATVRKLTLELYADSHEETLLGPFYLDWVFPRLEEVNLHFTIRGCSECFYLEEALTLKEAKKCASKLYTRQVEQLKKLLSLKKKVVTFDWERHFAGKRWSTARLGITD